MSKPIGSFFEIKDPSVDSDQVVEIITVRLNQRRLAAQLQSSKFEQLTRPVSLRETTRQLTFILMVRCQAKLRVKPYQVPDGINFFSTFILRLKKLAHDLVVYYVNTLAKKQRLFNGTLVQAIKIEQSEIAKLREQITVLEKKLQRLEASRSAAEIQQNE